MTESAVKDLTDKLSEASVVADGVSFKGKSLKLNSEEDCDEVVDAINKCKDLQYLNLEGNTLGVEASKAISKALESKSELKRALWMDMFTGRMKEEIPRALEHLGNGLTLAGAQLTELDLSDNAFGPIGVQGLAGLLSSRACYQLQVLKLNNNGLGSSGGKMLADALLECHKNSAKEGKSLALRLFVAGRNRLENKGAAELAKVFQTLGTLEEIVLPQNGIFHVGIKALSESFMNNPNLKVLDLNDNIITKKGANHIAGALPHLQQLKILNLGDCLLRTSGATVLAKALTDGHRNLEELHLGCNEIRSNGGLAVVKAVTNKSKLKHLTVNGNMFGENGINLLKDGLEKNNQLDTLGGLSDDEGCDDDETDEDDDDDEDKSEEESDDEEEQKVLTNGNQTKETSVKDDAADMLISTMGGLSMQTEPSGPLKTFLENPTPDNLLAVGEDNINEFIKINQNSSVDFYINTFVPMLIKISSLISCGNEDAMKLSSGVSSKMYNQLFLWAAFKNQVSMVNNALLVHLGLIKSEDKSFKINWDVKGSLSALVNATLEGKAPPATQNILEFFLKEHTEEITISEMPDDDGR